MFFFQFNDDNIIYNDKQLFKEHDCLVILEIRILELKFIGFQS